MTCLSQKLLALVISVQYILKESKIIKIHNYEIL